MKKAILCVDDEIFVLRSLKTQIKNYFGDKYLYEIAENAEDAWEVIDELVQSDLAALVGIDGIEDGVQSLMVRHPMGRGAPIARNHSTERAPSCSWWQRREGKSG